MFQPVAFLFLEAGRASRSIAGSFSRQTDDDMLWKVNTPLALARLASRLLAWGNLDGYMIVMQ